MKNHDSFYQSGLRFTCKRCSACCRFEAGYVFLSWNDARALAVHLNTTREKFIEKYCREIHIGGVTRLSLQEKENYDCIFWVGGGCIVYPHRPLQCKSYPFWPAYLGSRKDWEDLKKKCPGINTGRLHKRREIDHWLERRNKEAYITIT